MNERREFKRFNIEADVVLKPEDGTARVINADLYSIGFLGVGVYATEEIGVDVIVNFELTSKLTKETIVCEGKVIYTSKVKEGPACMFRIGINFINIDSAKNQTLFNFIQHDIILREKNRRLS